MTKPLRCKLRLHDDKVIEAWDERRDGCSVSE